MSYDSHMATTKKPVFPAELKAYVAHSIREILEDPDFGLELTEKAKRRLRAFSKTNRRIPLSDILKRYS